jgi:hypothetical protein
MKSRVSGILIGLIALSACTWVKTTEEGAQVQLVTAAGANCLLVGTVTTSVKDSLGPINRDEGRVREELIGLARNRAAVLGGNTIVMSRPPVEGEAGFDVYSCT